jgi:hypothetical protein
MSNDNTVNVKGKTFNPSLNLREGHEKLNQQQRKENECVCSGHYRIPNSAFLYDRYESGDRKA